MMSALFSAAMNPIAERENPLTKIPKLSFASKGTTPMALPMML